MKLLVVTALLLRATSTLTVRAQPASGFNPLLAPLLEIDGLGAVASALFPGIEASCRWPSRPPVQCMHLELLCMINIPEYHLPCRACLRPLAWLAGRWMLSQTGER